MKRLVMSLIGIMMIFSLAACTPTSEKNKTGEVKETQGAMTADDREPDQTAPELIIVSVYEVSEDGKSLKGTMDAVEEVDEDTLCDLLIDYGVLPFYAWAVFDPGDEVTTSAGPGVAGGDVAYTNSVLELSVSEEDVEDPMVVKAVARTYMENMNSDSVTVVYAQDGEVIGTYTMADTE